MFTISLIEIRYTTETYVVFGWGEWNGMEWVKILETNRDRKRILKKNWGIAKLLWWDLRRNWGWERMEHFISNWRCDIWHIMQGMEWKKEWNFLKFVHNIVHFSFHSFRNHSPQPNTTLLLCTRVQNHVNASNCFEIFFRKLKLNYDTVKIIYTEIWKCHGLV